MGMTREFRVYAGIFGVVAGSLVLTGCLGGPTYGTDKTAGEHLMDDLGSTVSIDQVVLKLPAGWGERTQTLSV